jgi:23S rRNA pseudouridine1911/1915/1917 synthase
MSLRKTWRPGDAFLLLHKDSDLVVVDKKAGVLTVGRPSGRGVDLMTRLTELLGSRATIIPVHRLDRPVSGVLVVARHARAELALREQFAAHDVERRYIAAVSGILAEDTGTYESTLASEGRTLRVHSAEEGRTAITHWRVLERFPGADATLVEVALETGRRNQIRVHFAEAGHPLLGERKYLDEEDPDASSSQGTHRIFLHAEVLGFIHPRTGHPLRFEADLPPDLVAWRRALARATRPAPRAEAEAAPASEAPTERPRAHTRKDHVPRAPGEPRPRRAEAEAAAPARAEPRRDDRRDARPHGDSAARGPRADRPRSATHDGAADTRAAQPRGPRVDAPRTGGPRGAGPREDRARGEAPKDRVRGAGPRDDRKRGAGPKDRVRGAGAKDRVRGAGPRDDRPRDTGPRGAGPRGAGPRGAGPRGTGSRGARDDAPIAPRPRGGPQRARGGPQRPKRR